MIVHCTRCRKELGSLIVKIAGQEFCYDCYEKEVPKNNKQKVETNQEFYSKIFVGREKKLMSVDDTLFPDKSAYIIETNEPIKKALTYDELVNCIVENIIELAQEHIENLCEIEGLKDFKPFKTFKTFLNFDMRVDTLATVKLTISKDHAEKLYNIGFSMDDIQEFFLTNGNTKVEYA